MQNVKKQKTVNGLKIAFIVFMKILISHFFMDFGAK